MRLFFSIASIIVIQLSLLTPHLIAQEAFNETDIEELKAFSKYISGDSAAADDKFQIAGMGALVVSNVDPKVQLARNLLAVRKGQMKPIEFFQSIPALISAERNQGLS
ncbi:MAG: hypothetical protein JW867_03145 [Candidatus Omnitrophica bacterium]|nr:hypothetical protein [Candidatus Omnitrophota bacterium]